MRRLFRQTVLIYSKTKNGSTSFYLTQTRSGNPHSASISTSNIPNNGEFVAYVHTHPNSNSFSEADLDVATDLNINAYVVGPNLQLQRYDYQDNSISNVGGIIVPTPLTDAQKTDLNNMIVSWESHFVDGVCPDGFECENKLWPNEGD